MVKRNVRYNIFSGRKYILDRGNEIFVKEYMSKHHVFGARFYLSNGKLFEEV